MTNVILASLPSEIATAITPGTPINPCLIIKIVQHKLLKKTLEDQDSLQIQAFNTIINNYENVDDSFIEHDKLRTLMILDRYPNIDDETKPWNL